MKKDVSYVVSIESTEPVNAKIGIVGPQGGAYGGANQLHFNIPPEQRSQVFKFINARPLK